jgi:hypothetical protein
MKKSEIYRWAQHSVLKNELILQSDKLEILRELMAKEDLEKFCEEKEDLEKFCEEKEAKENG